ncbi:MAG: EAL domain-containing protein [Amphritea sp.]
MLFGEGVIASVYRFFCVHILPGLAYILVAKLSISLFAIPPSDASAIWPAAGISISAIMLLGYRACLGLFIALLLFYLDSWLSLTSFADLVRSLSFSALLSVAALLQAAVAVFLIDRFVGRNNTLIDDRIIIRFLFIVGPVASLVAATVAMSVFVIFNILPPAEFLVNWLTWWIGDSIGAMLMVPLLLTLFQRQQAAFYNRRITVGLPLLAMMLVISAIFFITLSHEEDERKRVFNRQAQALHTHIEDRFEANMEVLYSLSSFFRSSKQISETGFSRFSEYKVDRYPEIQALEWIPRIPHSERQVFENFFEGPGAILERTSDGQLVQALPRDEYYPVMYLQPLKGNERAYGYDVASNPVAHEAQQRALAEQGLALTAPITLIQENGQQKGIVAYLGGNHSGMKSGMPGVGLIAGVYRVDDFVVRIMRQHEELSRYISLKITDVTDAPVILFKTSVYDEESDVPQLKGLQWQTDYQLGGRAYRFEYRPVLGVLGALGQWNSWIVLLAGMLFTTLLGGWLLSLTGRTARTEGLVSERTESLRHEIVERKRAEQELRKLSKAVEFSPYMVLITKPDGVIEYASPKFSEVTGYQENEVEGLNINILHYEKIGECSYADIWQELVKTPEWRGEIINQKKDGTLFWAEVNVAPIYDSEGLLTHYVSIQQDVTEARLVSEQLNYQASHDQLTDLVNRREFEVRLEQLLKRHSKHEHPHAFCFLDLDQFKVVNDTCGHIAGDELLRQISSLLHDKVRSTDTLARLGGDEFGILMHNCPLNKAEAIAQDIRDAIAQFKFSWEQQVFSIGASIGVVAIDENSISLTEVLKQADSACYTAKDTGRNRVHVYQHRDELLVQREGDMRWVTEINSALEDGRFILYGQVIEPLQNPQLKPDIELLIRMLDREGNIVPPGAFLPAAERYHLSSRIDQWVVNNAFLWLQDNFEDFVQNIGCCAINLSGTSLGDKAIKDTIVSYFDDSTLLPYKVKFEITETSAIANLSEARRFIHGLKAYGCQFSLDDFGSGFSSFAYLKNLPVDNLKIDGLFVKGMVDDELDLAMVKSINDIGHVMGKTTIAEFVENEAVLNALKEIGVDYAQGYGLGRPKPLDQLLVELSSKNEISA